ncbi:hypothetical protein DAMA08_039030 [Martiniozyma asiatica (nom. inval.)]|nr:hypothetical protein DAMA08_039030 [Martiniozyma asiatica]
MLSASRLTFKYSLRANKPLLFTRGILLGADGKPLKSSQENESSEKSNVNFKLESNLLGANGEPLKIQRTQRLDDSMSKSEKLQVIIKNMIKTTGPIPIASFMKECLINPNYGYYTTRNPLDSKTGDFITSPEISSTFGEICGLWFFAAFLAQLKHQATHNRNHFKIAEKKFRFIEFGPGKGTLMADIIRTMQRFIKNKNPIEIVFIEKSEVLIYEQYKTLCDAEFSGLTKVDEFTHTAISKWGNKITWLKDDKPEFKRDPSYMNFVVAHEFFDALPMNRFVKTEKGWREYLVDIRHESKKDILPNVTTTTTKDINKTHDSDFVVVQAPYATPSAAIPKTTPRYEKLAVTSEIEISPESHSYMYEMANIVKSSDVGAGLIIDYGTITIPINSLRGIKDHKFVNPLSEPGEVDLSIDVDFGNLAEILKDLNCESHTAEQGDFLNNMGLGYRIDQLLSKHVDDEEMKKKLIAAYKRLTGKGIREMGKIYKVLGYFDSKYKEFVPPGFVDDKK